MDFKKYNEIENSYNTKSLMKHLEYNPRLSNIDYIVREKLDGANLQLLFQPFKEMLIGKRSQYITEDDSFFDVRATLQKYRNDLIELQGFADLNNSTLRVYGELFGPGINGRVNYGKEKQIAVFDVYVNDIILTQNELELLWDDCKNNTLLLAPVVKYVTGLDQALSVNEVFDSLILNEPGNLAEGIVITPYDEVVRMPNGERFILKKKTEAFSEKMKVKTKKSKEEISPEVLKAYTTFREYINENRVLSCFSKHGNIAEEKQIGDYIRLIREDAIKDFEKDHSELTLTKDDAKIVYNVGKEIVFLLRKYL